MRLMTPDWSVREDPEGVGANSFFEGPHLRPRVEARTTRPLTAINLESL